MAKSGCFIILAAICVLGFAPVAQAGEQIAGLKAGGEVYSNVVVTEVTATDIYFTHARGLGNAKLKSLDPALQKRFHFDPEKAEGVEKERVKANVLYREELARRKSVHAQVNRTEQSEPGDRGDIVAPHIYARTFRGQPAPQILVQHWLGTPPPDAADKFVLLDFWASWCPSCRQSIPHLNDLAAKFKDRLIVVGLSNESLENLRKLTSPKIDYFIGTDTEARTLMAVGVRRIPHALLIDPAGIVRFEGRPDYLTEDGLARLLAKYSDGE